MGTKAPLLNPPGEKLRLKDQYHISKVYYYWPPWIFIVLSGILNREFEMRILDSMIEKLDEENALKKVFSDHHLS